MKKLAGILCVISFLIVSACNSKEYEQHITASISALQEEQYEEAIIEFQKAEKIQSTEEVKKYIQTTEYMRDSVQALEQNKYEASIAMAEKVIASADASEVMAILKKKAQNFIAKVKQLETQVNEMNEKLAKAQALIEDQKIEEAKVILKELAGTTSESEQVHQVAKQAAELWQQVVLTQIEEQEQPQTPVPKPTPENPLTPKQAEGLVRAYMKIPNSSKYVVQYEQDNEKGHYVIHVYEQVDDPNLPHNATIGWYAVNPKTGEIYNDLMR